MNREDYYQHQNKLIYYKYWLVGAVYYRNEGGDLQTTITSIQALQMGTPCTYVDGKVISTE